MLRRKSKKQIGFFRLSSFSTSSDLQTYHPCGVYLSLKSVVQFQPIFHLLYVSKILIHITQALNSQTSHTYTP